MKLLAEFIDFKNLETISEGKSFHIKGPFLQSEVKNKNGRIYSKELYSREVERFNEEKIKTNRALGELDHPSTPSINLNRVSHKIESLVMEGNDGIGTAKILDTPMGRIATSLIQEGIVLGVSSRGVGTLSGNCKINDDYRLITIDLVADPSAPGTFVNGILESKNFIIDGDSIVEVAVNELEKNVNGKRLQSKELLKYLKNFLQNIQK